MESCSTKARRGRDVSQHSLNKESSLLCSGAHFKNANHGSVTPRDTTPAYSEGAESNHDKKLSKPYHWCWNLQERCCKVGVGVISISPGVTSESQETASHSRFYHFSVFRMERKPTPCIRKMFFYFRTFLKSQWRSTTSLTRSCAGSSSRTLLCKDQGPTTS